VSVPDLTDDPRFQDLPEHVKTMYRDGLRCLAMRNAEIRYFHATAESVIGLAYRIRIAGELAKDKRPCKQHCFAERCVRDAQTFCVTQLERMIQTAIIQGDSGFFQRLYEASILVKRGIPTGRSAAQAAVLAIYELHERLNRNPTRQEIIGKAEQYRNTTPLSKRHWRRILSDPFISSLLQ
jgi:hypothetical protein